MRGSAACACPPTGLAGLASTPLVTKPLTLLITDAKFLVNSVIHHVGYMSGVLQQAACATSSSFALLVCRKRGSSPLSGQGRNFLSAADQQINHRRLVAGSAAATAANFGGGPGPGAVWC